MAPAQCWSCIPSHTPRCRLAICAIDPISAVVPSSFNRAVNVSVLGIDTNLVLQMVRPVRYVGPCLHLRPIRDPLQGHCRFLRPPMRDLHFHPMPFSMSSRLV